MNGDCREQERSRAFLENSIEKLLAEVDAYALGEDGLTGVEAMDAFFEIQITRDKLKAFVDLYPASGGGAPLRYESVRERFREMGVEALLEENLAEAVQRCNDEGEIQRRVPAAQGISPEQSREAMLQILFPQEREREPLGGNDEGAIDYRDKGEIFAVQPGDVLAILDPAVDGIPGRDIFGNVIDVSPAKKMLFRAGEGVVSEDGRHFVAARKGQPLFSGSEVSVKPVVVIPGDVDYGSGNVVFEGSVIVRGNVLDGFRVEAGVDVEIFGNVESAFVRAGRDLHVHGGILGEKADADAKGRLTARFVEGGHAGADGDVTVVSHLLHAEVFSCGTVEVQGRKGILGGIVVARDRIDAVSAGSTMGTRTHLVSGVDFRVREQLGVLDGRIKKLQDLAAKISEVVKRSAAKFLQGGQIRLPQEMQVKMDLLMQHYNTAVKDMNLLQDERTLLRNRMERTVKSAGFIKVKNRVFPGVLVEIRGVKKEIKDELRFISFYLDPDTGELVTGIYG